MEETAKLSVLTVNNLKNYIIKYTEGYRRDELRVAVVYEPKSNKEDFIIRPVSNEGTVTLEPRKVFFLDYAYKKDFLLSSELFTHSGIGYFTFNKHVNRRSSVTSFLKELDTYGQKGDDTLFLIQGEYEGKSETLVVTHMDVVGGHLMLGVSTLKEHPYYASLSPDLQYLLQTALTGDSSVMYVDSLEDRPVSKSIPELQVDMIDIPKPKGNYRRVHETSFTLTHLLKYGEGYLKETEINLKQAIDRCLDNGDKEGFLYYTTQLTNLLKEDK